MGRWVGTSPANPCPKTTFISHPHPIPDPILAPHQALRDKNVCNHRNHHYHHPLSLLSLKESRILNRWGTRALFLLLSNSNSRFQLMMANGAKVVYGEQTWRLDRCGQKIMRARKAREGAPSGPSSPHWHWRPCPAAAAPPPRGRCGPPCAGL